MNAEMHVDNVPSGRKVRAIKTCPWWCDQDDDHLEFGDAAHYSDSDKLTTDQLSAWLDTVDDGVTVELRLSVRPDVSGGTVKLSALDAQTLIDELQAMVDIANGSTSDNRPPVRDDIIGHAAWLQERIDAAVLTIKTLGTDPVNDGPKLWLALTQVITVLEGVSPPETIVRREGLNAWAEVCRQVEVVRSHLGNLTLDEAADPNNAFFVKIMQLEERRRAIAAADVLHPDVRR